MTWPPAKRKRPLAIGIGHAYRSDDALGLVALRHLRACDRDSSCDTVEHSGEASGLMALWEGRAIVFVLDAICDGGTPGTVRRIDALVETLPTFGANTSTHAFGLVEAVELSRALDALPERLIIYGITGVDYSIGRRELPVHLKNGVEVAVQCLILELRTLVAL